MKQFFKIKFFFILSEILIILGFVFCLLFLLWSIEARHWLLDVLVSFSLTKGLSCLLFVLSASYVLYKIFRYVAQYYSNRYLLTFRKKIAFVLGSIAIVPILVLSIFMLFLYASLQVWFDDRVTNTVAKAVSISEIYLEEHKSHLSNTAMQLVRDIEFQYGTMLNSASVSDFLNKGVDAGHFNEALIFKDSPPLVLAKTTLSFFSLSEIPPGVLHKVAIGKSMEVYSDTYGVQVLSRFIQNEDTYLVILKAVDKQIVEYLDQTNGAVASYERLLNNVSSLKTRFVLALCCVALLLLGGSVYTIAVFAAKITSPLQDLVSATTRVQDGDLNAKVSVSLDNDEISVLSRAFNEMVVKLKSQKRELLVAQKSLAWSEVARRVAHEINNPLTPIKLSAEILQSRFGNNMENSKDFKKYTTNILEYVDDIQNIISSFVYFARLPQPNFQKCSLSKWLSYVVDVRRNTRPHIAYSFNNFLLGEVEIMCDINQMSQVINNLLTNAEEALFDLKAEGKIEISLQEVIDNCKITISDNGPGFSLKLISNITEPYVSTKSRSSGLGLAIVDKIVKEHNGVLEFSNKEDGGARVVVLLPKIQFEA